MVKFAKKTYRDIVDTIGKSPVESGGILGRKGGVILAYCFDRGNYHRGSYTPCAERLDPVIREWAKKGISFCGIVHSHPNGLVSLSEEDKAFAEALQRQIAPEKICFPVVTVEDGVCLTVYSFDGRWENEPYDLIDADISLGESIKI